MSKKFRGGFFDSHCISPSKDEDAFDPEDMGATAAVSEYDKKSVPVGRLV